MAEPYAEECVADECRSPAARIAQDLRDPLTGISPSEAPLGKLSRVLRARSGHFGTKYLPASSLLIAESSAGRISASPCGLRVGSLACTSTLDKTDFQKSGCLACRKVENCRVLCPGHKGAFGGIGVAFLGMPFGQCVCVPSCGPVAKGSRSPGSRFTDAIRGMRLRKPVES